MKLIASIFMSFVLIFLILISWVAMGILITFAAILTLPIWAYEEYKDLTKDGRG